MKCFDSKMVDEPKRLSHQLTFSKVNIFSEGYTFCVFKYIDKTSCILWFEKQSPKYGYANVYLIWLFSNLNKTFIFFYCHILKKAEIKIINIF